MSVRYYNIHGEIVGIKKAEGFLSALKMARDEKPESAVKAALMVAGKVLQYVDLDTRLGE